MVGSITNGVNSMVNTAGSAASSVNNVSANAQTQKTSADLAGGGEAAAASQQMMAMQDKQSAQNIMAQGQAAMQTEQRNTQQAISSAQTDAANKEISNVAQTAKGISY
ncbi:hypothetical protein [Pseudomonas sp.]|uniref:hypothetical protein n=1 Tax=Pseudomonas sp. TaxID=306 RepID=UPI0026148F9B|nr:hypothetical protein [Pseudomonas sp.]